ncbi:MAG: 50S ribosomal protein L28 [Alphaproteobacteria bacterium CG_4_10_14_0_8_um_filter_53_9]|nr:MAG: 50S ribosomal protein L28 [Alphaproteobacteria bacterium CG_4_10_14_0_8_um_filter_53_9]
MSRVCELTGKRTATGNNVSHSNRHTKRTFRPNLQEKSFELPMLGRRVTLKLSTQAIRTIDKHSGLQSFLLQVKNKRVRENFSPLLAKLRFQLVKKNISAQA